MGRYIQVQKFNFRGKIIVNNLEKQLLKANIAQFIFSNVQVKVGCNKRSYLDLSLALHRDAHVSPYKYQTMSVNTKCKKQ